MRKKKFFQYLFCILVSIALLAWAFEIRLTDFFSFDSETKGIMKVTTESDGGVWNEPGTFHYTLARHKRIQISDPFEADKIDVYNASSSLVCSNENGKIVNRIKAIRILDENDREVEITQEFDDIVHLAAQINHDIMAFDILKTEAHTFVYIELNVNLWTPCILYYYNPETRTLSELHEWDDERVTAIRVLNPNLLKDLRPKYRLNPSDFSINFLIP